VNFAMTSTAHFEHRHRPFPFYTVIVGCLLSVAGGGCGSKTGHERFLPSEEVARRALELVLEQWHRDEAPAAIAFQGSPTVQPVDSLRPRGQKLLDYEILGEVSSGGPKCFAVRVQLDHAREGQKLRYVVLGQDPLWVVRQEDFVMVEQWCQPISKDASKSGDKKKQ
jgi:hypothetical protein